MEKKNTVLLTVIAVATLLVAVVGATFAFFTASTAANDGTSNQVNVTTENVGTGTVSLTGTAAYNVDYLAYPGGVAITGFNAAIDSDDDTNEYSATYNVGYKVVNGTNTALTYTIYKSTNAVSTDPACDAHVKEQVGTTGEYRWYYSDCNLASYTGLETAVAEATVAAGATVDTTFVGEPLATDGTTNYYYYLVVEYPNAESSQNTDQGKTITAQITGITGAQSAVK